MESTPNLSLPYIMPSQAQKHVTHNEALRALDALVHLAVLDRDLTEPPAEPGEGQRHIVGAGATGEWDGKENRVAAWQDGGWTFYEPESGWVCFIVDESLLVFWSGAQWEGMDSALGGLQNVPLLGVGATADETNPFSARLNKALWTARTDGEGGDGDLRYTLNKQGTANVLSLLMQSGWSGRAEIGLVGDDDLSLRVSADGSAWRKAITIGYDDGKVGLGNSATNFAALNIKGRTLNGDGDGLFGICVANTDADAVAKGGVTLVGPPYANANKPFMTLGTWATSGQNIVFYGGGGWNVPEATHHNFYTGAHEPTVDNTATLAFAVVGDAVVSHRPLLPGADDAYSLGASGQRWSVVYAATGTISTSDERLKRDVAPVPLGLGFVRDLRPVSYRWKVGGHAIVQERVADPQPRGEEAGEITIDRAVPRPGGRVHYGLLAQQVKQALDAHAAGDFAGWTLDDRNDPDSQQGLRYDQFVPILIRAVQELATEVETLRAG